MKTVYKYQFNLEDLFCIRMPAGAEVLTVQVQHGVPHIWALVDSELPPLMERLFRLAGTGHPLNGNPRKYIGTFQVPEVDLVFHLFEEIDA